MVLEDIVVGRDPNQIRKYGKTGCGFIGKHVVGSGFESHVTNPVKMDLTNPHVILILGKRGSGKCLHGDTLISLSDGRQVPIKELNKEKNNVFGLDEKLKISELKKDEFFSRKVNNIITLKLRSGKEIKLTPEHPLLTIKGWEETKKLRIGSRIATPRKIKCFGNSDMADYKIKLLAYLIAEGHLGNGFVLFSNADEKIVFDFRNSISKFDEKLKIEDHGYCGFRISKKEREVDRSKMKLFTDDKGVFCKGTIAPQKKSSLHKWLINLGLYGKGSHDKFIPGCIFELGKEKLALFLNILFSCDGSIYKHKTSNGKVWEISYASSSKKIIQQVHHLLLRFGILSRIRKKNVSCGKKNFSSYEIAIGTDNITKFVNEIGFLGDKEKRARLYLEELAISDKISNPNVDTIPKEIWDVYRPENWAIIGEKLGYKTAKALRSSINYSPSRGKLLKMAIADDNDVIKSIAESDIFWDEIVSMEKSEGNVEVFDISVPKIHNFVANDIIVHNSYTGGVIAEEMVSLPEEIRKNLCCIMIDTMGIYWSMKQPNNDAVLLLKKWDMKPKGFETLNIVPEGLSEMYVEKNIPFDGVFSIRPAELSIGDWSLTFGFDMFSGLGILLERVISKLKGNYSIDDIISVIQEDTKSDMKERLALENRFSAAKRWGIFSEHGTNIQDWLVGGRAVVLDISLQEWSVRNLLLGILAREVYQIRTNARREEEAGKMSGRFKMTVPMVWFIMDEAHNFLPHTSEGKTTATEPLLTLLRQGRQPGISTVFITQRPNKLHPDAISQADLVISHRLTSKEDLDSLSSIMQTYLLDDIKKAVSRLPKTKGSAVVLDDSSERLFNIQVRPRKSWHAGGTPIALSEK
jgi:uncharacterized protein